MMIKEDFQRILNDPAFDEVMSYMEDRVVSQMKRSGIGDLDKHHELVLYLQLLESMKSVLKKLARGHDVVDFNAEMTKKVI